VPEKVVSKKETKKTASKKMDWGEDDED